MAASQLDEKIEKGKKFARSKLQKLLDSNPRFKNLFVPVKKESDDEVTVLEVYEKHGPAYDHLERAKSGGEKCEMFFAT